MEKMCDAINEASDIMALSFASHLYIEYSINELVVTKFIKPKLVIDDNNLGSFGSKVQLLEALGLFDHVPNALKNIKIIQGIRNYYAHNLVVEESTPQPVKDRITKLVYFENNDIPCDYDVPYSEHAEPLHSQLHVCAMATNNALIIINEEQDSAHQSTTAP